RPGARRRRPAADRSGGCRPGPPCLALQQLAGDRSSRGRRRRGPLARSRGRRHPFAHRRAGAAGRIRGGARGPRWPRRRGRLHTIDATVNDDLSPAATEVPVVALTAATVPQRPSLAWRWLATGGLIVTLISVAALVLAWRADERMRGTERELVKRQQESAERVAEANLLAHQAQDSMRDATAKVALLEARLNEIAVQRDQLEDLIQSVARSRDENLLTDIESALRAAMQQAALTGSAEPLVATLKQSDDRLARANQPRLE